MPIYNAPLDDFKFALNEWIGIEKYSHIKGYEDASIMEPLMEEGARYCEEVLFPINQSGDEEGLKLESGKVTLPNGFVDAYKTYVESGWPSFACVEEYGGQGLPNLYNTPFMEMVCSSNLSFGLLPGLSHGAYSALNIFGNQDQKEKYLTKLISGEWTGIMCLTEPGAGTDLGLMTTKAEPQDDGTYKITGSKIFISFGEHDAAENIVHLVLARLPDAPEGVRGISLFVTTRNEFDDNGVTGERRKEIECGAIEHKMGIHASPTCVMNYDGAFARLVGEPNKGLKAMFVMMNEARLLVGLQGLGISEVAYQNALAYAEERLQGRALKGAVLPNKKADPITAHPDVRRMLLTMRSLVEGNRILAMWTYLNIDIAHHATDEKEKQKADDFVQFITPVVKSFLTEMGTYVANLAIQVHGGYGYIKEYGVEQYLRDCRITEIYEGTNGVQALDLVGRKLPANTGRYLRGFTHEIDQFISDNRDDENMAEFTKPLYQVLKSLQQASLWIAQKGMANPDEAAGASSDYLRLVALTALAYIWAKSAKISLDKKDQDFYATKIKTARFYMHKILPEHFSLLAKLTSGVKYLEL